MYDELGCKSFYDYHMAYLKTDALLFADVFEKIRKTCLSYYSLDPANYLTAPGLAWDAMLLQTGVHLDLITDLEMLKIFESAKRGGLCFVGSKRHVKANNKYLDDYSPKEDSNFLMYWDANNLYGKLMNEYLPYGGLEFVDEVNQDTIMNTPDDGDVGYEVVCDLSYPVEIHEKIKEFPPAPENLTPEIEWFSGFQTEVGKTTGAIKDGKTQAQIN